MKTKVSSTGAESSSKLDQLRRPGLVMALIVAVWTAWLGYLALHRFHGLGFEAFDLGIFDQGIWLLSRFEEPFVTLRGLQFFADHASYIVFLLVPLYWVYATPITLIVLATITPAIAGWLTYRIGRIEGLRPWLAVLVGVIFLVHPAVAWTPWDAFHPETLAIALLPGSYLAARKGRFGWALLLAVLILLVKEDSGLLVAPYALFWWFRWKEARKYAYVLAAMAIAIQAISLLVVLPAFSPTGELIYASRYKWNAADLLTLSRFGYLLAMLIPAALAFWAPKVLLLAVPISLANLASAHVYQHEIAWHYTAYALGIFAVAMPVGASRLVRRLGDGARRQGWFRDSPSKVIAAALLVAVGGFAAFGPDLVTNYGLWSGLTTEERAEFDVLLAAIPDGATVSATYNLAPHLAHRTLIYMAPNPWRSFNWGAGGLPLLPDSDIIEYLAVDPRRSFGDVPTTAEALRREGWIVVVDGTFLLLRNPTPIPRPD